MPQSAGLYYALHNSDVTTRLPVVLIHGAASSHLVWPAQMRRLAARRVLAVDLPGHGKSDGMGRQSLAEYALDLLAWLDSLELRQVILAGHSMGGGIALSMALDHPERVGGLVLMGSGARLRVRPELLDLSASAMTNNQAVEIAIEGMFTADAQPPLVEATRKQMLETRFSVTHADFHACNSFDVLERLGEVTCPTLVVCGDQDRMTPLRYNQSMAAAIPGAQLAVISGAGHMLMLEKPAETAAAVQDFLGDLG